VLEYECNVRNLGIDYALVVPETGDLENPRAIYRRMNEPAYPAHLAGILIWQTGIDKPDWSMLVSRFQSLGKSMALFEEAGEHPLPRALWAKPGVRLYEAGFSALSGKEMGRFLLRMGHRRIAYLSPVHGSRWSQNRLQGIREAYREAGLPDGVRALVHEPYVLPSDTLSYQMGLLDEIGGRLAHRSDPEHTLSSRLVSETLRSLSIHAPLVLQRKAYEEHVVPLMEAAYADRSLTAWVGAEDDTAIPCLRFLQEHGMAVPEDVSVVGFDDSLESFMHRLTSYNYDGPAYVRMMLSHVLSPGSPESGGVGNHPVELPGTVVIRQSVGPPPNSGT